MAIEADGTIVMDRPGVLNRVASLMRARNFNIDSLAVSRTDQEGLSRMTITLHGDDVAVEQAAKQLIDEQWKKKSGPHRHAGNCILPRQDESVG